MKPISPAPSVRRKIRAGPSLPLDRAVDRFERSQRLDPFPDDVVCQKTAVVFDARLAQGHQFDEADLIGMVEGQAGEVEDLVVVEPL